MVFVPEVYTPERKWPAILFLHGFMGMGGDGHSQVATGLGHYLADNWREFPFIVVFPQSHWDWRDADARAEAIAALDQTQAKYSLDPERINLMGVSLGGYGAYLMAAENQGRFASLVTMSAPSAERVAGKITGIPVRCYHYETDLFIGCSNSVRMTDAINKAGGDARLTKSPGFGHYVWNQVLGEEFFGWMLQQSRPVKASAP